MSPAGGICCHPHLGSGWGQLGSQCPEGAVPGVHLTLLALPSFPQGLNPLGFPNGEQQLETQNILAELIPAGFQLSNLGKKLQKTWNKTKQALWKAPCCEERRIFTDQRVPDTELFQNEVELQFLSFLCWGMWNVGRNCGWNLSYQAKQTLLWTPGMSWSRASVAKSEPSGQGFNWVDEPELLEESEIQWNEFFLTFKEEKCTKIMLAARSVASVFANLVLRACELWYHLIFTLTGCTFGNTFIFFSILFLPQLQP